MDLEAGKRNLINLLDVAANIYADFKYASYKTKLGWVSFTYKQVRDNSNWLSAALLKKGLKKGDNVSILSEGSPMWIMAEFSLLNIGAVSVPLSVKLLNEELPFRFDHSESKAVFVSKNHLNKILDVESKLLNKGLIIIYMDDDADYFRAKISEYNVQSSRGLVFSELLVEGKDQFKKDPSMVVNLKSAIKEDDVVNISYTSGTTGNPKGIMLTHLNYYSNAKDGVAIFNIKEGFKTLVILPIDHSFAHTVALYGALFKALDLNFLDARGGSANAVKNIPINLAEVKPGFLLTVPALTYNFMNKMIDGVKSKGIIAQLILKFGLLAGMKRLEAPKNKPSLWLKIGSYLPHKLASIVIFSKFKNVFGGRIKYMVGGGALLDIRQQQFYHVVGLPVFQGYGLTEAAPIISANTPTAYKIGSSGKLLPGVECRIMLNEFKEAEKGKSGEIVIKGDNVMKGYYKNKDATAKCLKDGWLWTGDLGYFDEDDFLIVTGRNKSLLISEDGEKYSPEGIEEAIVSASEFIGQAMIYNDHKKYTTAVVTLDPSKLKKFKGKESSEVLSMVKHDLNAFKRDPAYANKFPQKWTPSYFYISPEQFTENNKMVNSTLKLVRYKIVEHHKAQISKMYERNAALKTEEINLNSVELIIKHQIKG